MLGDTSTSLRTAEDNTRSSATLKRFIADLASTVRGRALLAIMLMLVVAVTEGLGVALFLPALQLAGMNVTQQGAFGRGATSFLSLLQKLGLSVHVHVATVLMLVAGMFLLRTIAKRLELIYIAETMYTFVTALDVRAYRAIIGADWTAFRRHSSSEYVHLFTNVHERLLYATLQLLTFISAAANAAIYIVFAFLISPGLSALLAGSGVLLAILLRTQTVDVHRAAIEASAEMSRLSGEAIEHLQNVKAIKTYDAKERDLRMFSSLVGHSADAYLRTERRAAAARMWFDSGALAMLAILLYIVLQLGHASAATILLLLALFTRIMPKVSVAYAAAQTVTANLPAYREINFVTEEMMSAEESEAAPGSVLPLVKNILFENVSFGYENQGRQVLENINLQIESGKITAIVGPSGSGKSTIADILMGLVLPQSGRVAIDGVELTRSLAHGWRRQIGYVAQETVLFHDSVRANLLWAKPDASESEINAALHAASAEFVLALPNGLDTVVGERGALLSQGERQRIALARVMLRNASVLILDEATNNLDSENERKVMESVVRLRGRMAVLIIAHQFSAVRHADQIYLVEAGKVVESGQWQQLCERAGTRFRELYQLQLIGATRSSQTFL